jgi:plasmid segregation protein ParM
MKSERKADGRIPEPIPVGLDDGYAAVKVAFMKDGKIRMFSVPSRARMGLVGIGTIDSSGTSPVGGYRTEGINYTVSPDIEGEETRVPDYNVSPLARVLSHHALVKAGFGGKPVRLASGLPPNDLYDADLVRRKIESFAVPVERLDGGESPAIADHRVYPQGVVAVVDWLYDGVSVREQRYPVGVVDIGGQTTDLSVILPPESPGGAFRVDREKTVSFSGYGVLSAMSILRKKLIRHFGLDEISTSLTSEALRTGIVRLFGKESAIQELRDEAISEVSSQIATRVRSVLGKGTSLDAVLFVGGGSRVFSGLAGSYPNALVPENPEFANARGMLKILTMEKK